jgi:DNA repair protein RadC
MDDDLPEIRYGPRERMRHLGESRLSDAECLALVLRRGGRGETAEQLSQRLLQSFGSLVRLGAAEMGELMRLPGLGPTGAAALSAAFGLARRLSEGRCRPGTRVRDAADVARVVREASRGARQERFFAVLLDARHRVLGLRIISVGSLSSAPVHPREVFGPAIREGAAALILAHNHPSGDSRPSEDDQRVTERLRDVGDLMGIEVLDHVVVGGARYYSFAQDRFRSFAGIAPS